MSAPNPCSFDDLKKRPGPPLNAWGLWGEENELGRLNLITPDSVKRGNAAVKHGVRVGLNLPINGFPPINEHRNSLTHKVLENGNHLDDEIHLNTQCATQWDGFVHVPYQNYPEKGKYAYHGGLTEKQAADPKITKFKVQNFATHPISSRAHLLDVVEYRKSQGKPALKAMARTGIEYEELLEIAKHYGLEFAPGDILLVRTGFTEQFGDASPDERKAYDPMQGAIGIEASEPFMRWVWDQGFPAVATDTFAFEAWPPTFKTPAIHEVFLAGWGLPLGELFDLRELSRKCKELNQYTFLFTSCGLNIVGGVATPPNAQAIL